MDKSEERFRRCKRCGEPIYKYQSVTHEECMMNRIERLREIRLMLLPVLEPEDNFTLSKKIDDFYMTPKIEAEEVTNGTKRSQQQGGTVNG